MLAKGQSNEKKGDKAWEAGRYKTAVNNYNLVENIDENKKLLAKRGLGYYKLNRLDKAISDFTQSKKLGNDDPYLYFLMGSAKQHLGQYEEAAFFYKQYVKEEGDKSKEGKIALREIKNAAFAAFHINDKSTAFLESFGKELNSYYDEIYVIQSPQQGNAFYYTSNNNLSSSEVYLKVVDEKGKWSPDSTRLEGINSSMNDYAMDISPNGQSMIFSRAQSDGNSKIYVSAYDFEENQHVIELPDFMFSGAVDLNIVDRNTIAFASKELGGEGGYDIFTINYKNGVWSDPINQGPIINSEYDERSPYFASNESYLYFSSNRPYCFGGYDIYYYNKLGIEVKPTNMGMPLNSAGDDLQFRLHQDGQFAVLSSNRKSGSGAFDIYKAYLQDFKPMPIKDTVQLEYVTDYLKQYQPEPMVAVDNKKVTPQAAEKDGNLDKSNQEDAITSEIIEEAPKVEKEDMESKGATEIQDSKDNDEEVINVAEEVSEYKTDEESSESLFERIGKLKKAESQNDQVIIGAQSDEANLVDAETTEDSNNDPDVPAIEESSEVANEEVAIEEVTIEEVVEEETMKEADNDAIVAQEDAVAEETKHTSTTERQKPKYSSPSGFKNALLYQDRHDLMNEENKDKMDNLRAYLKQNLDHSVHLIAHTDHLEPGLEEYMQYNTLKRATLIANHLMENGISRQRISIESVSNNFPVAKEELAGETNQKYLYYNKRIDWEIRDKNGIVLTDLSVDPSSLPGFALDRRYELFHQIREDVYFSVEIASSPTIFKNAVLRLYDDIYIRKNTPLADNLYYIGILPNYADAVLLKEELEVSSAPYAKIVAFHHGKQIPRNKINEFVKEFPELQAFKDAQQ